VFVPLKMGMVHLGVWLGSATTSAAWRLGDPQGLPSCTNAHAQQPCIWCMFLLEGFLTQLLCVTCCGVVSCTMGCTRHTCAAAMCLCPFECTWSTWACGWMWPPRVQLGAGVIDKSDLRVLTPTPNNHAYSGHSVSQHSLPVSVCCHCVTCTPPKEPLSGTQPPG
jgi:hypothetical protein